MADFGARGEERTANMIGSPRSTVLHDLDVPYTNGRGGNIDHIVVSGKRVLIIDSKMWKPGFYWTLGEKSRRGWSAVPHLDKTGMKMVRERVQRLVEPMGGVVMVPVVVVHASSQKSRMHLWAARYPHARLMSPPGLKSLMRGYNKPADARIVSALRGFLI